MIRLALAVGFLSVFGVVAYALVLLLSKKFKDGDNKDSTKHEN